MESGERSLGGERVAEGQSPMGASAQARDGGHGLFADLYELTMLSAYGARGMNETATFSLFVRELPASRNFLLACGLDDLLDELQGFRFSANDIAYLRSLNMFPESLFDDLPDFRFAGDVFAVAEGTPIFANEPLLEVTAPIGQAQVVETLIVNQICLQSVLASKAARVVAAAAGRPVVDFGARRAQGLDAALKGARAFAIAGVAGTSLLAAGARYHIPVVGTMAHSFVQAFDDELEAFAAFAEVYPSTVLLVDTYDTLQGVRHAIELARRLGAPLQRPAMLRPFCDEAARTRKTAEGSLRACRAASAYHQPLEKDGREAYFYF